MTPLLPRITCIMPTVGARRQFLERAVDDFLGQDYPNKELVIVDEPGSCTPLRLLSSLVRVATLHSEVPLTIGAKRNLACALADGEIICHWDDDDVYASDRLTHQVTPILAGEADITGLPLETVLTRADGRLWLASPTLASEIFPLGVHGGTLMYRRALWNATAAFANVNSGEDGGFLRLLLSRGASLVAVPNAGRFVYVRHESTWPLGVTTYTHANDWREVTHDGADLLGRTSATV